MKEDENKGRMEYEDRLENENESKGNRLENNKAEVNEKNFSEGWK